jgi:hypothetical protein
MDAEEMRRLAERLESQLGIPVYVGPEVPDHTWAVLDPDGNVLASGRYEDLPDQHQQ